MLPNVCCVCVTNTLFSCESENFGFLLLVRRLSSNCYIHTQFNRNVAHTRFRSTCTQSDHCIINFSLAFVVVVVVCFSHALWICKAVSNGFFILFNFQNNTTKNPTASSFFLSPFMYGGFFFIVPGRVGKTWSENYIFYILCIERDFYSENDISCVGEWFAT